MIWRNILLLSGDKIEGVIIRLTHSRYICICIAVFVNKLSIYICMNTCR